MFIDQVIDSVQHPHTRATCQFFQAKQGSAIGQSGNRPAVLTQPAFEIAMPQLADIIPGTERGHVPALQLLSERHSLLESRGENAATEAARGIGWGRAKHRALHAHERPRHACRANFQNAPAADHIFLLSVDGLVA
jgi:hypothetical protein